MRVLITLASLGLLGAPLQAAEAAEVDINLELPRLQVAEYHRPYVAVWLSKPDHSVVSTLAVWYQQHNGPEGEGTKWLKDMRQWWRRIGRSLDLPIDGVTGPTRAPGTHHLTFSGPDSPFAGLEAGEYLLHVEASREVGGREVLSLPFSWPGDNPQAQQVSGSLELGSVTLKISPE
ncbi:DUF2271 domain-containing protein [Emcibacter sp.]|uniref:DUF2271 domain-containing protein n=1 Tax=Emcibacter sp. TaxID=1979954 RepID=UPI003A8C89D9